MTVEWCSGPWRVLEDPRMPALEHGWKLHVSVLPEELDDLVGVVRAVLARHVCHAKFARDAEVVRELNAAVADPASVGKAVTLYPSPEQFVEIAWNLVGATRGRRGPRVAGDRRVAPEAPVYYRYGPFSAARSLGPGLRPLMVGPDGRSTFPASATLGYRRPPWAPDPFGREDERAGNDRPEGERPGTERPGGRAGAARLPLLGAGGRYRIEAGIRRGAHGNVYRALDLRTGRRVVVKQARAYVGEDRDGLDARDRLRHERRVLRALSGIEGIPEYVDHFAVRGDEFLVMSDRGPRNLRRVVREDGPLGQGPESARFARRLESILDAVHARGVAVRDLKPDNVVLAEDGACSLIDFGISTLRGTGPDGGTAGYGAADDRRALGLTLGFAFTGLDPVVIDADESVNLQRTLAGLDLALADDEDGGRERYAVVAGAVGADPRGWPGSELRVCPDVLAEAIEYTAVRCAVEALRIAESAERSGPVRLDIYEGIAGLGRELLHHGGDGGNRVVREAVDALAACCARRLAEAELPSGLYIGRAGVELFLAEAVERAGAPVPGRGAAAAGAPGALDTTDSADATDFRAPDEGDQISGAAGLGLGSLMLSALGWDRLGQATQCARKLVADLEGRGAGARTRGGPAGLRAPVGPGGRSGQGDSDHGDPDRGLTAAPEGFAHGEAGRALFLREYAAATADPAAAGAADVLTARLVARLPGLVAAARGPRASWREVSWCNGLAGIGSALVRAPAGPGSGPCAQPVRRAARACLALAPRVLPVGQCCGLSGLGEFLIDLAALGAHCPDGCGAADEAREGAEAIARIIFARSGGTLARPLFPDDSAVGSSFGWAAGSAGVLAFLRRLRDGGGPRAGYVRTDARADASKCTLDPVGAPGHGRGLPSPVA